MAFQTRGSQIAGTAQSRGATSGLDTNSLNSLVDQLAEAVRSRLLEQGVPLSESPIGKTGLSGKNLPSSNGESQNFHTSPQATWQGLASLGADRIGTSGESPFQPHLHHEDQTLAAKIDHTLLKPEATREEITRVCEEARKHHFATVCVNSNYIGLVADLLRGSGVKPIAVVGFPLGAASTASKAFEAREAIRNGAQEIDMVINLGALKSRDYAFVLEDIRQVVEASKPYAVKVILETSSLPEDQKVIGCALSKAAGAAFVKTSTGFASGGATAEDIALMRRIVGPEMGVKASGGIRTYEDAAKMIEAGASRIGASASVAIVLHQSSDSEKKKGSAASKKEETNPQKKHKTSLY